MPRIHPAALALGTLALLGHLSGPSLPQASASPSRVTTSRTSVATPRLGLLELQNGYPTAATARKLYDELDLQRATQAHL